jgi:hypothetical protein
MGHSRRRAVHRPWRGHCHAAAGQCHAAAGQCHARPMPCCTPHRRRDGRRVLRDVAGRRARRRDEPLLPSTWPAVPSPARRVARRSPRGDGTAGKECAVFRTSAEVCVIAPTSTSPSATWHGAGTVRHFTSRCNAQPLTCNTSNSSTAATARCNGCGGGAVQPLRDRSDRYKSQPNQRRKGTNRATTTARCCADQTESAAGFTCGALALEVCVYLALAASGGQALHGTGPPTGL